MTRIRTVKPDLFRHEDLFNIEVESGLPIRLSYIALFTVCDKEGRFRWRPKQLKLDCLPYDDIDFSRVLDALASRGFVVHYENLGVDCGFIPSFKKHQFINNRESESILPNPEDSLLVEQSDDDFSRVKHASSTRHIPAQGEREGEREREKEKEKKKETCTNVHVKKKPKNPSSQTLLAEFGINENLSNDFIAHRKLKKAAITETALNGFQREADKAKISLSEAITYSIERGWITFKNDWYQNAIQQTQSQNKETKHDYQIRHIRNLTTDPEDRPRYERVIDITGHNSNEMDIPPF